MKKMLSLLTAGIVLVGFFGFGLLNAADGSILDQSYEVITMLGYGKVGYHGHGQTFRPTMNRISSINVYLTNRTPDSITMTIQNPATKEIIGTDTHALTFAGDAAWETFSFTPSLVVQPETEYVMYLSSNVDNETRWMSSDGAPQYTRGFAVLVDDVKPYDRLFREYGKNVTEAAATPVVAPPAQTTTTTTTTTAIAAVQPPVLTYVMNGDKRVEAPLKEDLSVTTDAKVILYGTSFKGAKVTVIVGNVSKLAETDADGNWTFTVDNSLLVEDSVSVSAQAQDSNDKDSAVVALAKLKKAPATVTVANAETKKPWYQNRNLLLGLLALGLLVLAALGGLLYYLIKHRKPKGSVVTSEKVVENEEK